MKAERKTKAQLISELETLRHKIATLTVPAPSSVQLQDTLQRIAAGVSATTGEAFFQSLVQHLAQTLEVDYAFVSELSEGQGETVSTTAAWAHGKIIENFQYELANTPCEHVVSKQLCYYQSGVQQLFPCDTSLVEMGVDSYVGTPLFDGRGRALGLLVVMHSTPLPDPERAVTVLQIFAARAAAELERQRTERALRESEERYSKIFHYSNDAIFIVDPVQDVILDVNPKACSLLGFARDELLSTPVSAIHPEEMPQLRAFAQTVFTQGKGWTDEFTCRTKSKERIPVEISASLIDLAGRPCLLALVRDASERRQAEAALRESEQRYRLLFEHNPHPMWVFDHATLAFLAVNDAAVQHYGYTREEFLTMTIRDICPPEEIPRLLDLWRQPPSRGINILGTWKHRKKDGTIIDVDITTHPLTLAGRRTELVLAHDVTERKRAEEERQRLQAQLFQAQKLEALGTLAGGIAHDFNNMLSAIIGFTDLALDEIPQGSVAHRNLQEVLQASRRAKGVIQQMLTFSRPGQQGREFIHLHSLVEETLALLQVSLPTTIELRSCIGTRNGTVLANPTQLQQVLMNLCVNAAQAMQAQGGVLEVGLSRVPAGDDRTRSAPPLPAYLRLTVSDTGPGIPAKIMERIFEPFFTTKPVGEGSGLGLAIAHSIVTAHGGTIHVESEVGRGTTIYVDLPQVHEVPAAWDRANPTVPGAAQLPLVGSEDSPGVRKDS
jgi:PAS domain S-box-containing protein